ncbi:hypothetical protein GCM10022223_32410 [Kineosporia mesophila]|uniref:SnoaL-like domain-containing protein n=1 Tax=Kineosporia mesophila TaxID=566012 RepID=A0ABP6ZMW4_9ACTN|nr:nuclear transport factor 2 family protein [Kineosporia mesophila]MCD5354433.1 nuclear transport factor 2 family protein [Kineosporia mesophila]
MSISIDELLDRAGIEDALHRYAQAQDQNAWNLLDHVFTDEAQVDLVGLPAGTLPAQAFGQFLRDFNSTRLSGQHLIANTLIEVTSPTARSVSEVLHFTLQRTDDPTTLKLSEGSSLYADTWLKTDAGWRISHRVVTQKHLDERVVEYDADFIAVIEAGTATDWFQTS